MRRGWIAFLLAVGMAGGVLPVSFGRGGAVPGAAAAVSLPLLAKPTDLTADEITVDNTGTTLEAAGHVTVRYGELRATGDLLRLSRPAGTGALTGHVTVTEPRGRASADAVTLYVNEEFQVIRVVLDGHASVENPSYAVHADQIVADRKANRLAANGHTSLFAAPDITVTGATATYDLLTEYAVVTGDAATPATVRNKDGRLQGSSMEVFRPAQRLVVHGPVEAEAHGATLTADNATVDLRRQIAVVTGHVAVTRARGTLHADRVTVLYRDRRIVAEGATHLTLADLGETELP